MTCRTDVLCRSIRSNSPIKAVTSGSSARTGRDDVTSPGRTQKASQPCGNSMPTPPAVISAGNLRSSAYAANRSRQSIGRSWELLDSFWPVDRSDTAASAAVHVRRIDGPFDHLTFALDADAGGVTG